MIYLDYAATTPVDQQVQKVICQALDQSFANPSAGYRLGKSVKHQLMMARQRMKELLNLNKDAEIYFTSCSTEAINWALKSQAYQARELGLGNQIVTTTIEHSAVMRTLEDLADHGFEVVYLDPDDQGQFHLDQFIQATTDQTIGWTVMAVNNEMGSILPIHELGAYAKEKGFWFHVDATQAIGYQKTDFDHLPCTSFSGSGHKFYAPKGIGFLVYQPWHEEMTLHPLLRGGGQEYGLRSGTENLPYILGMVKALELIVEERDTLIDHFDRLSQYFIQKLNDSGIDYQLNGDRQHHNQRIHNIWFKGHLASQVLIQLDLEEIYISAGSACSAGSVKPSRVLKAYYPDQEALWGESLRISFGKSTSTLEIDQLVQALQKINR